MAEVQGFKERLISFINYLNIGVVAFERSVGFPNGSVRNIRRGMTQEKVMRISNVYPQLNMDWLVTGEGEMIKPVTCEEYIPYTSPSTPYGSIKDVFDELKVLRQKMEIYEGKIENYEQERTQMLDTMTQLTSIISRLTEEREKLANKNK